MADECYGLLGVGGGGGLAGADGPDGFVGDDEVGVRGHVFEAANDLSGEDFVGGVGLALGEGLADAEDGYYVMCQSCMELAVYEIVILSEEGPALRVAHDDVVAEAGKHSGGNFAGECAFGLGVEVLGAELEGCASYLGPDCREGDEGGAEEDFHAGRAVQV